MVKQSLSGSVLQQTLRDVERDEAEAITALCRLLEQVEESRNFDCLPEVRDVLIQWQNKPPGVIVSELARIAGTIESHG